MLIAVCASSAPMIAAGATNDRFAVAGIPAHTLSSFNLHTDYHRPQDEARFADGDHMTAVIEAAARAVQLLSTGSRPECKPGARP